PVAGAMVRAVTSNGPHAGPPPLPPSTARENTRSVNKPAAAFRIVALSIAAAIVYGIVHDQVTVRVCVEYFTIGHAPLFATESPTLLAVCWGIAATWWVGLLLGLPLAFTALRGPRPVRTASSLVRPI